MNHIKEQNGLKQKNIKQLLQQLTPSNIKQTVLQLFQINLYDIKDYSFEK